MSVFFRVDNNQGFLDKPGFKSIYKEESKKCMSQGILEKVNAIKYGHHCIEIKLLIAY